MIKKQKRAVFRCSACGHEEPKWLGRCPACSEWNTLDETAAAGGGKSGGGKIPQAALSLPLSSVDPLAGSRVSSGIPELDRVLGGGIMTRSAILVGGEPGIGKSTLLLQAAGAARTKGRILYISGEESAGQVRMRSDRLGIQGDRIEMCCTGRLETIESALEAVKPVMVIADSAQTLHTDEAGLVPGTINQMKYCAFSLISWVKEHDAALFLSAHVTKEGLISGPKTLEHMVDTVLYFEQNDGDCRFLRAAKNRFGSVDEIGIFTMGDQGLVMVEDPSLLFLVHREGELPPGVATAAVLEGTRSLLVEIQALTVPAKGAVSRVFSDRVDSARVSRVAAIIEKHLGLRLSDQDIYINVAGGIRITEVGVELALAGALYSARVGVPLPAGTAITGELSLAGEARPPRRLPSRIKTSLSLGFDTFLCPQSPAGNLKDREVQDAGGAREQQGTGGAVKIREVRDIKAAVAALFQQNPISEKIKK
ncbi:MAG: DNA repair protein RadA [Spirochaetaceae bacterium]|jgi:DNA repair protein RadA/Sms|nr:DNA repair protein RadA [Spirochaetaceae bacterium]